MQNMDALEIANFLATELWCQQVILAISFYTLVSTIIIIMQNMDLLWIAYFLSTELWYHISFHLAI